jgi:hypothetical protein
VLIGRTWSTLRVGESETVPAGMPHAFRNRSGTTARFLNVHAPAFRFAEYFRTVHRSAKAGKLKGGADPRSTLYACVLMKEYGDTIQTVGTAQRVAVNALAALGQLLGVGTREPEKDLSR